MPGNCLEGDQTEVKVTFIFFLILLPPVSSFLPSSVLPTLTDEVPALILTLL